MPFTRAGGDIVFSPEWAKHVSGRYPLRKEDGEGSYEPQPVQMRCDECGDTWQVKCESGNPSSHVLQFARAHAHKDPFTGVKR